MNIILGIIVLLYGFYEFNKAMQVGDKFLDYKKVLKYKVAVFCIILGIGLIFDLIKFW